jgi:hypothetical protein
MAKPEPREYRAMISDEGGVVRGRIPSTLVRDMGARAGDYMVFRSDASGAVTMKLSRTKAAGRGGKSSKAGGKSGKRR